MVRNWMALVAAPALLALVGCDTNGDEPNVRVGDYSLVPFESCASLESYAAESVLNEMVGYRYGGWGLWAMDGAEDTAGAGDGPSDYTTTNVQEAGVDEPDFVKTDGSYIYVVHRNELSIVSSWPTIEAQKVGALEIDGYPMSMFLRGDRVVVFSYVYGDQADFELANGYGTRMSVIDVSNRAAPKVLRTIDLEGWMTTGRMIDGNVYLVTNSSTWLPQEAWELVWDDTLGLPDYDWEASAEEQEQIRERAKAILAPRVAEMVAAWGVDQFLPHYTDRLGTQSSGEPQLLTSCENTFRSNDNSRLGVLSVVNLDLDSPLSPLSSTSVLADGWTVYASQENLYVARSSWWSWWGWGTPNMDTQIHKFELADGNPRYVASGAVAGWLLNQFSMSEYDGYLRVASTEFNDWWSNEEQTEQPANRITVMKELRGELEPVGVLDRLAPGERIYASRMMGDKGYLVTFVQTDPLFTIDLSNPSNPRKVGELHMPGFSTYLHPMDGDHLLSIGRDGDDDGNVFGMAINVFDVSNFAKPELAHKLSIGEGGWSWSEALYDHHAFTYHRDVLSIPAYNWNDVDAFSGLMVFSVDARDGVEQIGTVDHKDMVGRSECLYSDCYDYYWYYNPMRRSIYIEDDLFSISAYGIKVNDLNHPDRELAEVLFWPR